MRTTLRKRPDSRQCDLAQAWDEGRASAILEMQNALNDLYGPKADSTPNPYRTQQEIAALEIEIVES